MYKRLVCVSVSIMYCFCQREEEEEEEENNELSFPASWTFFLLKSDVNLIAHYYFTRSLFIFYIISYVLIFLNSTHTYTLKRIQTYRKTGREYVHSLYIYIHVYRYK